MEGLGTQIYEQKTALEGIRQELAAVKLAPQRVQELFADIFTKRKEELAQKQSRWIVKRSGKDAR